MNNKEKIIKCRVKSDSTFTDLVGYDLLVVRDKAFYRIDDINPELENLDEKSESLFQKYCGFLIGREELDLNVYDHRKELAETFKGFKEGGAYSPIGKVDTSNPPKTNEMPLKRCKVKPGYAYYNDLKDLELFVSFNEKYGYVLEAISYNSFKKGDEAKWDKLYEEYRIGKEDDPFTIDKTFLDFIVNFDGPNGYSRDEVLGYKYNQYKERVFRPKESDPVREFESNNTRIYETGAKRASNRNKPFIHNLQPYTLLRFGYLTNMGAREYGDGNFLKGFPNENAIESLLRHITLFRYGDMSEDHLSSAIFNIQLLILNQEKEGIKPDHWFKYEK